MLGTSLASMLHSCSSSSHSTTFSPSRPVQPAPYLLGVSPSAHTWQCRQKVSPIRSESNTLSSVQRLAAVNDMKVPVVANLSPHKSMCQPVAEVLHFLMSTAWLVTSGTNHQSFRIIGFAPHTPSTCAGTCDHTTLLSLLILKQHYQGLVNSPEQAIHSSHVCGAGKSTFSYAICITCNIACHTSLRTLQSVLSCKARLSRPSAATLRIHRSSSFTCQSANTLCCSFFCIAASSL